MKKVLASSVVVLMVFFLSAGLGLARNGGGGGTGMSLVCSGVPVLISGEVIDVNTGNGLTIDDSVLGSVTVYGIGPLGFWGKEGIVRPTVAEEVSVDGMTVTFSDGTTKIIAMTITFADGTFIDLREECVDGVGGRPLWRGNIN